MRLKIYVSTSNYLLDVWYIEYEYCKEQALHDLYV